MEDYQSIIDECDACIRSGQPHKTARILKSLTLHRIPRPFRLPLARICRRSGNYALGLKLLSGPKGTGVSHFATTSAEPAELAEYGILLLRIGAIEESLVKLESIDPRQAPDAPLFRAFGRFARWEFEKSIADLQLYLEQDLAPYQRAVGEANLAFALVECRRHDEASDRLVQLTRTLQSQGESAQQLLSTCHALRAQVYLQENNLELARQILDDTHGFDRSARSNDHRLIRKLNLIVKGLVTKDRAAFTQLRHESRVHHDWVALRDADHYALKLHYKNEDFNHLLFGSPFPAFRGLLESEFPQAIVQQIYRLGPDSAPCFDLVHATANGEKLCEPGDRTHQLIAVLLRDFYEPARVATLFAAFHPDEHFDVNASPARIRQVIHRTRSWLRSQKIPAIIAENRGFYSLRLTGHFSFAIPLERRPANVRLAQFETLKSRLSSTDSFTNRDATRILDLGRTATQNFLNWAMEQNLIRRLGSGRSDARYQFKTATDKGESRCGGASDHPVPGAA